MKNNYEIMLRIPPDLADELKQVSETTNINRSSLVRMGLRRVLSDIKTNNIETSIRTISGN